ncbi:Calx-beta domain-containing protein [Methylocucumis oryzae]|uniref:Calx-beta domain-containing protein n=1 Tax=Methylocucumis oryzae TaxID=1632867 RepID=A0A0F3IFE3_9GAMM|nr:Calx-beta domain-containing protein [Methylocucumis oryzae]KJV05407.1 hypothetical protein VZ94_18375 [Methylocucumis oryzae]
MATPVISAQHLTVNEADATATLLIKLSEAAATAVTVQWSLSGLTASASTDLVNSSGTLTFNPGETQVELAVGLVNDATAEQIESFVFNLFTPSSNAVIGNSSTVISIVDNDSSAGVPILTVSDVVVDESAGSVQFVVMLDKPATGNVKLDFKTQNGSASAGSDYTAINGSLTFLPGETAKTITVPVLNDTAAETWENFSLVLSKVTGATAPDLVATALIAPNDVTAVNKSALTVSDVVVSEQDGFAEFVISLDKPNTDVVSVNYQTGNGTAIFNNDGVGNSGTLRFAPGETLATVRIAITNDSTLEATENFNLQLSTPSANAVINRNVGVATIFDNDAETGTPIAAVSSVVVDEAEGVVSFVVTLDKPSTNVITMDYASQNGTAVAGSDFTAISGTLVFAPGETTQTVRVLLNNDTLAETDENFALTLSKVSGATVLDASGTAIIAENDANAVAKPNISVEDIVVGEGDVYADFIVRLDAPTTSDVTMNFSTSNGTATFNNDAIGVNSALTFAPGETVKTVRVTLVNDANVEPAENFSLQLF